ncbi:Reelin, partial [Ophiophagus hannah]
MRKTRFRWIQESRSQKSLPPFGLDGVYISEPCPNYCNGQGDCISGVCFCDMAYTGLVVQYSNDNGISWTLLRELDFLSFLEPQIVSIELPREAKTSATAFRWWQPQHGMNDSSPMGFQDKFDGSVDLQANWYRVQGGQVNIDCLSMDTSLIFSENIGKAQIRKQHAFHPFSVFVLKSFQVLKHWIHSYIHVDYANPFAVHQGSRTGKPRYAETWDFHVADSTFMQFELNMGCSKPFSDAHGIHFQYSLNNGKDWHLVTEECVPPRIGCQHYVESSVYSPPEHASDGSNMIIPPVGTPGLLIMSSWPPDVPGCVPVMESVILGIVCDRGFGGPYCVPTVPLPTVLKDDFNGNLHPDLWPEVYGAERGNLNGTPERSHSILLQYSINGGITWHLIDEFYFTQTTDVLFINIPLPYSARNSATRFRIWQPYNNGKKEEIWIIDNFIIDGNNLKNPVILLDTFDLGPKEDNWFFYPGGNIGLYCPYSSKGAPEEDSAMINIGCTTDSSSADPVKLEFSRDLGATWHLLLPLCYSSSSYLSSLCSIEHHPSSTYYAGTTQGWRREVIHFGKLHLCGFVQFFMRLGCGKAVPDPRSQPVLLQYSLNGGLRWNLLQEFLFSNSSNIGRYIALEIPLKARSPSTRLRWSDATRFRWHQTAPFDKQQTWAIDNVYIGDGCIDMCDENWSGLYCDEPDVSLPTQLKDNFNRAPSNQNWLTVNGGKLSTVCGAVASGMVLHFSGGCSRLLVTVDLNLTKAEFIQFYFMYGCLISPNSRNQGVLLEYSVNGGITWTLLMEIFYDQFSKPGDWAIDNVLISGSADQRTVMLDTFSSAPLPQHERSPADAGPTGRIAFDMFVDDRTTVNELWMFHDDCSIEKFCDSPDGVLMCGSHDGREAYAITHDLTPTEHWIMQFKWAIDNFYLGPGCVENCRGHGDCLKEQCICDPGFSGPNCYLTHPLKEPQTFLDSFFILNHHNTGISWSLLHEMDYQKYISIRHDYILLPEKALTNTTRLRWWQPFVINNGIVVSGFDRAQWALDNILIGGAEINPSQL